MSLPQTAYKKHLLSEKSQTNNQNQIQIQICQESAFSDFFIRKNPKRTEFPLQKQFKGQIQRNIKQKLQQQSIQSIDSKKGQQQKHKEMTIFFKPNKKAFQIKSLQNKNQKFHQLQSAFQKQKSHKFKHQRQLIFSRKNNKPPIYTPRLSANLQISRNSNEAFTNSNSAVKHSNLIARYSNQISQPQVNRSSKNINKRQRKSIEICTNLAPSPYMFQSQEMSLRDAYKVKSLVLGRNPKDEDCQKSKKTKGRVFGKKQSPKKIDSCRIKSERPLQTKIQLSFGQTSRISTGYQSNRLKVDKFQSTLKQKNPTTLKLNHIFLQLKPQHHSQEITLEPWDKDSSLEPWSKAIQSDLHFHDKVQNLDLKLNKLEQNPLQFKDIELVRIESKPPSRRNSFRKIYSTKQNIKFKSTIFSEK